MTQWTIFLFSTAFLLLGHSCSGQTQLLKDYDFNKGGYYILGTFSESDRNGLQDSLGEFYTNDISVLNQLKKEWTFKKPSPQYACGYHYIVYICRNGKEIESFGINLNCNEIATSKGFFFFDTKKLRMFYDKLKKPFRESSNFTSVTDARNYRTKILSDSSLIMTFTPDWTKYEGTFDFKYKCKTGTKACIEKKDSLINMMKKEIMKQYPDENFELSVRGESMNEIEQTVSCNKTLSDRFNLYVRDTSSYFGKWEPYELTLTTYWTTKQK